MTVSESFVLTLSDLGTNGLLIPSERYIKGMRNLCTKYGIMLILDEVMSGFCRTGEWFACQHWGIEPDLMTMAKGLTSAYVPLGAVMVSKAIADHFEDKPLYAGLTYNSHSVGCAAAIACINAYKDDKILENTRKMGKILREELDKMTAKHPSIGDARSIGLFSMIEFVKDRKTREPLTPYNPKPSELGTSFFIPLPLKYAYALISPQCFITIVLRVPSLCASVIKPFVLRQVVLVFLPIKLIHVHRPHGPIWCLSS